MAGKLPTPNPPAKPRQARVKPASGAEPAADNTQGIVTPKTEPAPPGAPSNPPVKAETPQESSLLEKAGELLEKGEIGVLNKAKDAITGGIDAGVAAAGGGLAASVVGAIGKGAVEVLFPTNVIDLIPGGKVLSGGKKAVKLGEKALGKAGKEAAEKTSKEAAEKEAKAAGGKGGGFNKGTARRPRHRCELMKYKDMICDGEKHHVVPDFMMRTGTARLKRDASTRIPGTPAYDDAPAICLSTSQHQGLHKTVDEKIQAAGSHGTLPMGQAKEISGSEAAKKSGCNPKGIQKQLDKHIKSPDSTLLRAVKDARKVTQEILDKVRPDQTPGM